MDDTLSNEGNVHESANGAMGAVEIGEQHEWRDGRFKNFVKKRESKIIASLCGTSSDAWKIGI